MAIWLGFLVFLFIASAGLAIEEQRNARSRDALARIRRGAGEGALGDDKELELVETQSDLSSILSKRSQQVPALRSLELLLYRAGRPLSTSRFLALTGIFLGLGIVVGNALAQPGLALLGLGPLAWVWSQKRRRMQRFDEEFPQALALMSRALRAGHGISSGFQMVSESLDDPVGSEFGLVAREISAGLDVGTAIANLQDRLDAVDLPVFATAILVQLETGGNLAEILDNLGEVIRERMGFAGKVKALTAQSRMSATVLAILPFGIGVLVNLFDASYMEPLFQTAGGKLLLGGTIGSVFFGYVLCRRIARVEA